jgi:hypothetical protein
MIPEPTREAIRVDLRAGMSQRKAAAKHGVSLGTVMGLAKTLDGPAPERTPKPPRPPKPKAEAPPEPKRPAAPSAPAPESPPPSRIEQVRLDIAAAEALYDLCGQKNQLPAAVAAFKSVTLLRRELARLEGEADAAKIADPIAQTEARISVMVADGSHAAASALSAQLAKMRRAKAEADAEAKKKRDEGMSDPERLAQLEEDCRDAPDEDLAVAVRVYCERHGIPFPIRSVSGGRR